MFRSRMTTKGQVTIPIELRQRLGLNPHDAVSFLPRSNGILITVEPSIVDRLFGAVTPISTPEDFDALEETFEQGIADENRRVLDESRG